MGKSRRWLSLALGFGVLFVAPFLVARPTVPPPPAPRRVAEPVHLDTDGAPLPARALSRAGTLRFRHGSEIGGIVFSPDGRTVYTAAGFAVSSAPCMFARAWDVDTGREKLRYGGHAAVDAVDVSSDGKLLATGEADGVVRVWDAATGRQIQQFHASNDDGPKHGDPDARAVFFVRFSADGTSVAAISGSELVVWNTTTGIEKARTRIEEGGLYATNCEGRLFATVVNNSARVIDVATGRDANTVKLARDPGDGGPVFSVALSPDAFKLITTNQNRSVHGWSLAKGKELWRAALPGDSSVVTFSPNGAILAVACQGRDEPDSLVLLDAANGKKLPAPGGFHQSVHVMRFSPDGKLLATGGRGQTLQLWDLATGKERPTFAAHPGPVTTVAVSRDGRILATCSEQDCVVRLWDTSNGRQIGHLDGHTTGVEEVTISPDGRLLASAAANSVYLWDVATGRVVHKLEDHTALGPYLRFSDDGNVLATGSRGNQVALWDCATGKPVREMLAPPHGVAALLSFHDGRLLAYETPNVEEDSDVPITIWDLTANRVLRRFAGHSPGMRPSVALSADGRMLASRAADKTIRVWEMASGGERCRFEEPGELRWTGEWTGTQFLAFSPDGRTLVSGGSDEPLARRWDLAVGQELRPLAGHRSWVGALEFSADGRVLATGGQDTTTILWDGAAVAAPVRSRSELTDAQLVDRWDDLKDPDAGKAYQAILALGRGGDRVARGIGPRLQPTAALEPVLLRRYIEDLDDPQFSVREKAAAALLRVADQAEDDLRRVLERTRSPEVRQRIRGILDVSQDLQPSPDRLREVRAVEVLERVGTTAAREQLIRLAGGAERANLTREAKAALRRLDREAPDVR